MNNHDKKRTAVANITGQDGKQYTLGFDDEFKVIGWNDEQELLTFQDGDRFDYKAKNEEDAVEYIYSSWGSSNTWDYEPIEDGIEDEMEM